MAVRLKAARHNSGINPTRPSAPGELKHLSARLMPGVRFLLSGERDTLRVIIKVGKAYT